MAIISFDPDVSVKYVPKIDRKNIDKEDVFYVDIKFVTQSKVDVYRSEISRKSEDQKLSVIADVMRAVQKKQFINNVVGVHNYKVGEKEIKTSKDFYDSADSGLIEEILKAMEDFSVLSAGQKKT